jgi:uncharacterized metal-binding protein YceD (DUF177 family)
MMLPIRKTRFPFKIDLGGDEPWLQPLYEGFPAIDQTLKGTIEVAILDETSGFYEVRGQLSFSPKEACGRCAELLSWPIAANIKGRFEGQDRYADKNEVTLEPDDLEVYLLKDGNIDLYQIVLDTVYEALPNEYLPETNRDNNCSACLLPMSKWNFAPSDSENDKNSHPFSVLKSIKIE